MQKKIMIRALIALFAIIGIFTTITIVSNNKKAEIEEKCDRDIEREFSLSAFDTIGANDDSDATLVYEYSFKSKNICTLGEAIDYVNSVVNPKPFGLGNKSSYGRPLYTINGVRADYTIENMYWNSSSTTHAACIGQRPVGSFPGSPNTCQLGLDNIVLNNDKFNEFTWWRRMT